MQLIFCDVLSVCASAFGKRLMFQVFVDTDTVIESKEE